MKVKIMKVKSIEELFGTLQQSIVAEWREHLKTSKYSKHMALDEFYKEMPEMVDSLIEAYMGHNKEKVGEYKNILNAEDYNALSYLEALHEVCVSGRELLGSTELESDMDNILSFIDSIAYKVRELKETCVKSLKDFLCENLVNEARRHNCEIRFISYDRGGGDGYWFQFTATDHLDMLKKIVENINLYLEYIYVRSDATPDERESTYTQKFEDIMMQNGDGCDYIVSLKFDNEYIVAEYDADEFEDVFPKHPKKVRW